MSRLLLVLILCCSTVSAWATPGDPVSAGTGRPHLFMENRGQIHTADDQPLPQILYHLAGRGMNVSLTAQSIHYTFIRQRAGKEPAGLNRDAFGALPVPFEYETLGMSVSLIGANPSPMITAEEQQEYYENHYTASARQQGGLTNVRSYARIVYHDVYPLIDWEVYVPQGDGQGGVKYDFIVRPGGNPADVRLKYNGATSLSLLDDGSLLAQTDLGVLREARPYSYIRESGTEIACKYSLQGDILSFSVAKPAAGTLVIDPQVVWITYFGGGGSETCYDVASHQGDAYIGGGTTSISNVATLGSSKTYFSGNNEAYVARFSSAGILLWSTYFGHSGYEIAYTVTLDTNSASPSVFIAGRTDSQDSIATAGAHQAAMNGIVDGFLAKFTAAGKLLWSTYYGGELREAIYASACDAQGYLYIGGATESNYGIASTGFPGRYSPNYGASFVDGFVAKFSPAGVRQWGTHFGGEGQDWVSGIHAFRSGSIAITGTTTSNTNISTAGSHQSAKSDTLDAFIAKIGGSGNVIWSTYFGGDSLDISGGVTGDDTGSIFVCA